MHALYTYTTQCCENVLYNVRTGRMGTETVLTGTVIALRLFCYYDYAAVLIHAHMHPFR